jgi:hypothetical protein
MAFEVPARRSSSRHQLELIQRYSRILREQAAMYRGPRVGARERRLAREAAARATRAVTTRPTKTPAG